MRRIQIGDRFGKLTVIGLIAGYGSRGGPVVAGRATVRCDCGREKTVVRRELASGDTKSCGCLVGTHLSWNTPEYNSWKGAKERCYRSNYRNYHDYGGRGIQMCAEWRDNFSQFLADMGLKPGPDYSLDRIDVNGHYEPANCRWATQSVQSANIRKKGKWIGVNQMGEGCRWEVRIKINNHTNILGYYDTAEEGARARDTYITANGLPHALNFPVKG